MNTAYSDAKSSLLHGQSESLSPQCITHQYDVPSSSSVCSAAHACDVLIVAGDRTLASVAHTVSTALYRSTACRPLPAWPCLRSCFFRYSLSSTFSDLSLSLSLSVNDLASLCVLVYARRLCSDCAGSICRGIACCTTCMQTNPQQIESVKFEHLRTSRC